MEPVTSMDPIDVIVPMGPLSLNLIVTMDPLSPIDPVAPMDQAAPIDLL